MLRRIVLVALALCVALPLRSQTPSPGSAPDQPVFRAGTTIVEVSAIVTQDGVPVTDLTADEVEVLDEGRTQPLVAFEFVDLTTVEGPAQRRDFVLVLDDRHIAPNRTQPTRDVALAFIKALGPHDRLAIVNTESKELVQQLSTDRRASEALVQTMRGERMGGRTPIEVQAYARLTYQVLHGVATVLRREGESERRAVVLVSEGQILPVGPAGNEFPEMRMAYMDVLREAALANVAVYTIDVRGLSAGTPGGPPRVQQVMDPRSLPRLHGNEPATQPAESRLAEGLAAAMADRRFGSHGRLADHTGGVLTVDTNELGKDVPRILQESRQYYRLVYAQPDVPADETGPPTRRIDVKVSRPGVQVRARQQYVPVANVAAARAPTADGFTGAATSTAVPPVEAETTEEPTAPDSGADTPARPVPARAVPAGAFPDGIVPVAMAHGPASQFERGGTYVRTPAAWRMFWRHVPTRQAAPDVDFDRVTLLAVVLDDEGAAPHVPQIEGTRAEGADLVVTWRTVPADAAAGPVADARRPFVVVGITDYVGPVRFEQVK